MAVELTDDQRRAIALAAREHTTPAYLYFADEIDARMDLLRDSFGGWGISFAVKSNPNRALLARLAGRCDHLDISSGGELLHALEAGWDASRFTFVGPAKTDWELDLAVRTGCGYVVCESLDEVERLGAAAKSHGAAQKILLRVNPLEVPKGFGVAMSGRSTAFGIDEEHIDDVVPAAVAVEGVELVGFHVYAGSNCLDEDALVLNLEWTAALFERLLTTHDVRAELLVFGSGFGIPYRDGADPLDPHAIGRRSADTVRRLRALPQATDAHLSLEIGRYIVGEAGLFVTEVLGYKEARKGPVVILDGGMNHHLAALNQVGAVVPRPWPMTAVAADGTDLPGEVSPHDLAGPLCTPVDTFGRGIELPRPAPGDLVVITVSGAYGPSYSPLGFISHRPPRELLVEGVGDALTVSDITLEGPAGPPPARLVEEWAQA